MLCPRYRPPIANCPVISLNFYEIRPTGRGKNIGMSFMYNILHDFQRPFHLVLFPDQNTGAKRFWTNFGLKIVDGYDDYMAKLYTADDEPVHEDGTVAALKLMISDTGIVTPTLL